MRAAEDGKLFAFAGRAFQDTEPGALLELLASVEEICESDDSRQLVAILRHSLQSDSTALMEERFRLFSEAEPAARSLIEYAALVESGADAAALQRFRADRLSWISQFCKQVQANATHSFHRELTAWLRQEFSQ